MNRAITFNRVHFVTSLQQSQNISVGFFSFDRVNTDSPQRSHLSLTTDYENNRKQKNEAKQTIGKTGFINFTHRYIGEPRPQRA